MSETVLHINTETEKWENEPVIQIIDSSGEITVGETITLHTAGTFVDRDIEINPPIVEIESADVEILPKEETETNLIKIGFNEMAEIQQGYIDIPVHVVSSIVEADPQVNDIIHITDDITGINTTTEDAYITIPIGYNATEKTIFFVSDTGEVISKEEIDDVTIKDLDFSNIDLINQKVKVKNNITISGKTLSKILKSGRVLESEFQNEVEFIENVTVESSLVLFSGNYKIKEG